MKTDVSMYSDIGGREENEDAVGWRMTANGIVAVLTDGLGGHGDGKAAAQLVRDVMLQYGTENRIPDRKAIEKLFERANLELIGRQQNRLHMKTTAVYLCIADGQAIWAHVGDSRLYHLWNGKLCDYTLDHSAAQLSVYMGTITRDQIPGDAGQSRLLRAMGVEDEHPEIHDRFVLEKGRHMFLLCSDGLWEYLSDEEVERAYSMTDTPEAFLNCMRYVKNCRSPEDCDNNSAVAVAVDI